MDAIDLTKVSNPCESEQCRVTLPRVVVQYLELHALNLGAATGRKVKRSGAIIHLVMSQSPEVREVLRNERADYQALSLLR